MKYILTIPALIFFTTLWGQTSIRNLFHTEHATDSTYYNTVKKYSIVSIDSHVLNEIMEKKYDQFTLVVTIDYNKRFELELEQNQILAKNFKAITNENGQERESVYIPGLYYKGRIKGMQKSFVVVSFFRDNVVCTFSDSTGNYNIVKLKVQENTTAEKYIFYNDNDLLIPNHFNCGTNDDIDVEKVKKNINQSGAGRSGNSVCVYFECDYQFYQEKGYNQTAVGNFVTTVFNIVATLYSNENVNVSISQIYVWASQDPYSYTGTNSGSLLSLFANYRTSFNGDVAMLLTTRTSQHLGGVAYTNGLCSNPYSMSSDILDSPNPSFPTYSWNGNTVAHELGHLFGSPHTHWCGWAGGPIDDCNTCWGSAYPNEGGPCNNGPMPISGTIMSYCHGCTGVGINWANGFGGQPGTVIRNYISNASCSLGSCSVIPNTGDDCSNAIPITSNTSCNTYSSTVTGATSSGISIPYCSGSTSPTALDRWFSFNAHSTSETVTIDPTGNTNSNAYVDAVIALYSSCNSNGLIECYDETSPNGGGVTTTHTFNNLVLNQTYYIRVFDWGSAQPQYGDFDICVTHTSGSVPSMPTNLTLTAQTCSTAVGTWSACTNNPIGYEVYLNNNYIATTSNTSYSFTGLLPNTSYFLTVVAFNNIGYGTGSNQSSAITTPSCSGNVPSMPNNLNLTAQTCATATASWDACTNNPTGYEVYLNNNYIVTTPNTYYSFAGLLPNTSYFLTVVAFNNFGYGNGSNQSNTITTPPCTGTCAVPAGLTTDDIYTDYARFVWADVIGAAGYEVRYRKVGTLTWTTSYQVGIIYSTGGLTCATDYEWEVRTDCGSGNYSSWCTTQYFTTSDCCPTQSPQLTSPPNNSTVYGNSITFQWNEIPSATSYAFDISRDEFFNTIDLPVTSGFSINSGIVSLTLTTFSQDGTEYFWRVRATNGSCNTVFSTASFFSGSCNNVTPPTPILYYPPNGSTQYGDTIYFNWSNASCVINYEFQLSTTSFFNQADIVSDYTSPYFSIYSYWSTFGQPGHIYYWRVGSQNNYGWGYWSSPYYFITGGLTSVGSISNANIQLLITPNPNTGNFNLMFSNLENATYSIKIFDVEGRLIETRDGYANSTEVKEEFNMEGIARGIYLIQLMQKEKTFTSRFSKL